MNRFSKECSCSREGRAAPKSKDIMSATDALLANSSPLLDSTNPQIVMMRTMFKPKDTTPESAPVVRDQTDTPGQRVEFSPAKVVDYPSDWSDDGGTVDDEQDDMDDEEPQMPNMSPDESGSNSLLPLVPACKRCHLDISVWKAQEEKQNTRKTELEVALKDVQTLFASKKTEVAAGNNSLQVYRTCTIQSYLVMVVKRGHLHIEASERAAKSQGFVAGWGGRMVRSWAQG